MPLLLLSARTKPALAEPFQLEPLASFNCLTDESSLMNTKPSVKHLLNLKVKYLLNLFRRL
jgi:hypothetical protein